MMQVALIPIQIPHSTVSSRKYAPQPPFAHYYEVKVGREHLLEYSICLVHMPPPDPSFLTILITRKVNRDFWKNGSMVASLNEISG